MGGVTALSPAAACWLQAGVRSARHRAFAEVELPELVLPVLAHSSASVGCPHPIACRLVSGAAVEMSKLEK